MTTNVDRRRRRQGANDVPDTNQRSVMTPEQIISELRFAADTGGVDPGMLREAADLIATLTNQRSDWEYGAVYQGDNGIELRWFSIGGGAFTVREAAEKEVERFADAQVVLGRRIKPGSWEPVTNQQVRAQEGEQR